MDVRWLALRYQGYVAGVVVVRVLVQTVVAAVGATGRGQYSGRRCWRCDHFGHLGPGQSIDGQCTLQALLGWRRLLLLMLLVRRYWGRRWWLVIAAHQDSGRTVFHTVQQLLTAFEFGEYFREVRWFTVDPQHFATHSVDYVQSALPKFFPVLARFREERFEWIRYFIAHVGIAQIETSEHYALQTLFAFQVFRHQFA